MDSFLIILLSTLIIGLWLWAIIDISRGRRHDPWAASMWFALVLLFPVGGSIVYFQMGSKRRKRKSFSPDFH